MEKTIVHTWQDPAGIAYTLYSDLTITSDKPEIYLKQLDADATSFIANGKLYLIERQLSADRWIKMQELETELGFGMTYKELRGNMVKIYNLTNENGGRMGDIGRIAYDSANGVAKMLERQPQILKFCSLFFNTADEDRKSISDDQIAIKCEDFRKEGFAIDGFFVFALSYNTDLAEDYKSLTQNVLKMAADLMTSTSPSQQPK